MCIELQAVMGNSRATPLHTNARQYSTPLLRPVIWCLFFDYILLTSCSFLNLSLQQLRQKRYLIGVHVLDER